MPGSAAFGSDAFPVSSTVGGLPALAICQVTPMAPAAVVDQPSQIPSVGGVDTCNCFPTAAVDGSFHGSPAITTESVVADFATTGEPSKTAAAKRKILQRRPKQMSLLIIGHLTYLEEG